jgi:protein-tyrosine phosphatase
MTAVLFVCHANLCRSPMALAVAHALARHAAGDRRRSFWRSASPAPALDAAGTHPAAGEPIDGRAKAALERCGYAASKKRSRPVRERDFERFDLLLAMDRACLEELRRRCPSQHGHKLRLFLDFAPDHEGEDVPDPYFSDAQAFDRVLGLCEVGARALLDALRRADVASLVSAPTA